MHKEKQPGNLRFRAVFLEPKFWCGWQELNPRPLGSWPSTLSNWATAAKPCTIARFDCCTRNAQRKTARKLAFPSCVPRTEILVRLAGIEPTTPWFVAKYSIQLSYSREALHYSTARPGQAFAAGRPVRSGVEAAARPGRCSSSTAAFHSRGAGRRPRA